MITIIKKICKGIIIAIGTLITLVALVGGSVGIAYKKEVVTEYTSLRDNTLLPALDNLKKAVNNGTVEQIFTNTNNQLDTIKDDLNKIEQTYPTSKDDVDKIITTINNIQSDVLNDQNKQEIETLVSDVNNVSSQLESFLDNLTPQKFTKTYDDVTISLTAVSATILGVIILTSIVQLALYKKVEGVRVRRTRVKSDLVKHMDKILKKYPNLKNDF